MKSFVLNIFLLFIIAFQFLYILVIREKYIPVYTSEDLYYIYPLKNKVASEGLLETLQFQSLDHLQEWTSRKTIENTVSEREMVSIAENLTLIWKDSILRYELYNPYIDSTFYGAYNTMDDYKDKLVYYNVD